MAQKRIRGVPDREAEPAFEFCVTGPAVSAQAQDKARLRAWQDRVAASARQAWPKGKALLTAPLRMRVSEFDAFRTRDRDNFVKPIADALQGIVYKNDKEIVTLESEWKNLNGAFRVRYMSSHVAAAFVSGDPFVRIRVWVDDRAGDLD